MNARASLRATCRIDTLTFTSMLPGAGANYRVDDVQKRCPARRYASRYVKHLHPGIIKAHAVEDIARMKKEVSKMEADHAKHA
jgi:hypothetical protein